MKKYVIAALAATAASTALAAPASAYVAPPASWRPNLAAGAPWQTTSAGADFVPETTISVIPAAELQASNSTMEYVPPVGPTPIWVAQAGSDGNLTFSIPPQTPSNSLPGLANVLVKVTTPQDDGAAPIVRYETIEVNLGAAPLPPRTATGPGSAESTSIQGSNGWRLLRGCNLIPAPVVTTGVTPARLAQATARASARGRTISTGTFVAGVGNLIWHPIPKRVARSAVRHAQNHRLAVAVNVTIPGDAVNPALTYSGTAVVHVRRRLCR